MEQQVKDIFHFISFALNIFAGLVIAISAIDSAIRYILGFGKYLKNPVATDEIRLRLGRSLSFALEFLVGADILRTLIAPNLTEISLLAATVAIRVTLNFFLEREADHLLSARKTQSAETS